MFSAEDSNGTRVKASTALRGKDYFCPRCRERLTLVLGSEHMADHFRHHAASDCVEGRGAGESAAHKAKKLLIERLVGEYVGPSNVSTEHVMDDLQRPDVYFEVERGQGVAVEVQHSPISDFDLADRVASYSAKSVASIWMVDNIRDVLNTIDENDPYGMSRIPRWMRRISAMTDRAAYDLTGGDGVVAVKLKLEERLIRRPDGTPVLERWWPFVRCNLVAGDVRDDTDEHGWRRLLWIPRSVGGASLVRTSGVRAMRRREEPARAELVDCTRPVSESEFHRLTQQFWAQCGFSFDDRMKYMGFK